MSAWLEFPRGTVVWEGETLEVKLFLRSVNVMLATLQMTGWMAILDEAEIRLEPFRASLGRSTSYANKQWSPQGPFACFSTPPSVLLTNGEAEERVIRWRLTIPKRTLPFPTHTQSKSFRCWYVVQASVKTMSGKTVQIDQIITVLGSDPYWVYSLNEPCHWLEDYAQSMEIPEIHSPHNTIDPPSLTELMKCPPFFMHELEDPVIEVPPRASRFDIRRGDEHIAAVTLPRQLWLRGERLLVALDFTGASIVTHRVAIWLEQYEVIGPDLSVSGQEQQLLSYRASEPIDAIVWMHDRWSTDGCQIPLDRPASCLSTSLIVKWQLRIVFSGTEPTVSAVDMMRPEVGEEMRFEACVPLIILPRRGPTRPASSAHVTVK